MCSTHSQMAGVAGFEPTNDGVRGARIDLKPRFNIDFTPILAQFYI